MKQYSPPRVTTNRGRPWIRWRIGRRGMVMSADRSLVPQMGSVWVFAPMNSPSLIHVDCTNSNCLVRFAPMKTNIKPRSAPSSSRTPSGSSGP